MEQLPIRWEPERRIFTVSDITRAIRGLLEREFPDVWISGEISGVKRAASGHVYFTLKDSGAQLQCACWRTAVRHLRFQPQDGIEVLARGRIEVYPPRGQYQLIVDVLEPQGYGALQLAFEQLKKKLAAEGLFSEDRKRPLPPFPRRIGIVTSPSGAAIRDLLEILARRFPIARVRLYPALVQGEGSAAAVVEGIERLGASGWPDLIIVGRGGGSLEDLWTFNEEAVARAIAASPVPVVSAVGHETDFTIADFVADLRAPTPSAAAELVVPERRELLEGIETTRRKLGQIVRYRLAADRNRLYQLGVERAVSHLRRRIGLAQQQVDDLDFRGRDAIRARLDRSRRSAQDLGNRLQRHDLRLRLAGLRQRLEKADTIATSLIRARLAQATSRFQPLFAQLQQLSPLAVLGRGYAIVQSRTGQVIRDAVEAPAGTELGVRLSRGSLDVTVQRSEPAPPAREKR